MGWELFGWKFIGTQLNSSTQPGKVSHAAFGIT
jgi:hypothetical protein